MVDKNYFDSYYDKYGNFGYRASIGYGDMFWLFQLPPSINAIGFGKQRQRTSKS